MGKCSSQFRKFDSNLALNEARKQKIKDERDRLDRFLTSDDELKEVGEDGTILQGSYKNRTIIRPRGDGEYDVDVCWRVKDPAELGFDSVQEFVRFVVGCLRRNLFYADKVKRKNKCIRIDFTGEFHLDLVLLQNIKPCPVVTDYDANDWVESDPEAFDDWIHDTNKETKDTEGGPTYLLQTIRHVREWALEQFSDSMRPSGIFLSTFVGKHHALTNRVHNRGLECQFTGTHHRRDPGAILADTSRIMLGCWRNKGADKATYLPVHPEDDLTANWSDAKKERFEEKLEELVRESRKAAKPETTEEEAAEIWHRLFGRRFHKNG